MLEERIDDGPFLRLIRKWLKAGILETDGQVTHPVTGTPQGGVVSPILRTSTCTTSWICGVTGRSCATVAARRA